MTLSAGSGRSHFPAKMHGCSASTARGATWASWCSSTAKPRPIEPECSSSANPWVSDLAACRLLGGPGLFYLAGDRFYLRRLAREARASCSACGRSRQHPWVGKLNGAVRGRVAERVLRIAALGHQVHLLEHLLAHHHDAAVAGAQVLQGAIGEVVLADPGHEILVHDVARDPSAR